MTKPESKWAEEFRRLGFEKDNRPVPRSVRRVAKSMNKKGTLKPTYSPSPTETYVTDETGQRWVAWRYVDLSHLGFRNNIAWVTGMPSPDKRH